LPKLKEGQYILCDRYVLSSFAYQGFGRELGEKLVNQLNVFSTQNTMPDLTVWLDVSLEQAKKRTQNRGAQNRLDRENDEFKKKVHQGFLTAYKKQNYPILRLNAEKTPQEIFEELIHSKMWKRLFA
jgi:dTMP kinase